MVALTTSIALYPRRYNKRGEERLHSVIGLTLEGTEVNVKLRLPEKRTSDRRASTEFRPSIAEFSREDVKAKNFCLSSPENGPGSREGMLLFTGCTLEESDKAKMPTYLASWAYVLASHSESIDPMFGLGRIAMIANTTILQSIKRDISHLEETRPDGWQALVEHKNRDLLNPAHFTFYGQIYDFEQETEIDCRSRDDLLTLVTRIYAMQGQAGFLPGVLIRVKRNGVLLDDFSNHEMFPRWLGNGNKYQPASEVLTWYFRILDRELTLNEGDSFLVMPIRRYPAGASFKNYYLARNPEASLAKIREKFLVNTEPTVCQIAFCLTRREDTGDLFVAKYYALTDPVCRVAEIGVTENLEAPNDVFSSPGIIALNSDWPTAVSFPGWYVPTPPSNKLIQIGNINDTTIITAEDSESTSYDDNQVTISNSDGHQEDEEISLGDLISEALSEAEMVVETEEESRPEPDAEIEVEAEAEVEASAEEVAEHTDRFSVSYGESDIEEALLDSGPNESSVNLNFEHDDTQNIVPEASSNNEDYPVNDLSDVISDDCPELSSITEDQKIVSAPKEAPNPLMEIFKNRGILS